MVCLCYTKSLYFSMYPSTHCHRFEGNWDALPHLLFVPLLPCHYSLQYCLFQFIFAKIDNLLAIDKLQNQFCGIHCSFNIYMLVWCAIQGMRSILRYHFISKALLFLSNLHSTVISTHATTGNVHVRKVSC